MATRRVVAAVIRRNGNFLLCQRPEHKRHGGLWEFPGGKICPGESDADAIRRELTEELHVEPSGIGERLITAPDPDSEFVIDFFRVDIDGEPVSDEHDSIAWVPLERLLDYPLAPSDQQFVEHMLHPRRNL